MDLSISTWKNLVLIVAIATENQMKYQELFLNFEKTAKFSVIIISW